MQKEFIQEILNESKLSKMEFAIRIHVTLTTLNKWLSGKSQPHFLNQKIIRAVFRAEVSIIRSRNNWL